MLDDPYGKNTFKYGPTKGEINVKYKCIDMMGGYIVTAYKLQGCTIDKLLVDLNQRPRKLKAMDLRSVYVIISRG
jgi:hypothetical protein